MELKINQKERVAHLVKYEIKSSKLVKFKDTLLEAVKYTQSGSRGKLLVTFDQQATPTIRFHKVRGLKQLQQFDFNSTEDLDYKFTDLIETTRIEL